MISHQHRCIFIHVPKTGGSSVEKLIWTPAQRTPEFLCRGFVSEFHNKYQTGGLQHLLARQVRREVGAAVFDNYLRFSLVRNPWDKAVSQYAYMAQRPDLRRFVGMPEACEFKRYLELIEHRRHVQWEPQLNFLVDEQGQWLVDHIGRYEEFDRCVPQLLRLLGITAGELPRVNPSQRRPYPTYYDDEARDMVAERYADDIRAFGYRFDAAADTCAAIPSAASGPSARAPGRALLAGA